MIEWITDTALLPWWGWVLVGMSAWFVVNGLYVWFMARANRTRRWTR